MSSYEGEGWGPGAPPAVLPIPTQRPTQELHGQVEAGKMRNVYVQRLCCNSDGYDVSSCEGKGGSLDGYNVSSCKGDSGAPPAVLPIPHTEAFSRVARTN